MSGAALFDRAWAAGPPCRVTFLGTGTSHGVPMVGCSCATCRSSDPRDQRWRPSVLVEVADGPRILIDTSTDLRAQALRFGVTRVDAILYTHAHADHVLGLDDVRAFNIAQRRPIACFADAGTVADIRRMFAYAFAPPSPVGGGVPQLAMFPVVGPFSIDPVTIVPVPILHGPRSILGYRIGRFAYLTDCSEIPERSLPLLEDLDVLVLSALRDRPHSTHFSVGQALAAATRIAPRRTLFTHMCHLLPHAATCDRLPEGVDLAHDGLVLDLDRADRGSGRG